MATDYTHHKNGMTRKEYRKAFPEKFKVSSSAGKYTHLKNGMTRSEFFKTHPEFIQKARQGRDEYLNSVEGKARLAEHARELNATGVLGRKTPITDAEKQAASIRMKKNNPMKRPEVKAKLKPQSPERRAKLSEMVKRLRAEGVFRNPPPMTPERREAASARMKANNPMKDPSVRNRVSLTLKERYQIDRKGMLQRWTNRGIAPNKAELFLLDMITPLGFRFVGDGAFWVGPCKGGRCRNPDFVYKTGRKKIGILLNGQYWHSLPKSDDEDMIKDYQDKGWQVLVIWDTELQNPSLLDRIMVWLAGVI